MNADSNSPLRSKLSSTDAAELAAGVAQLTKAGLPLPAGLRALADELPGNGLSHFLMKIFGMRALAWDWSRRHLPNVLRNMADRLESGESLENVLNSASKSLPPHLYGLLLAGLRSGQLPAVMEEYLRLEESQRKLRQRLWLSLAYPIFLAVFLAVIVYGFNHGVLSSFEKIFKDFGTDLPVITTAFFAASQYLQWIIVGFAVFLCFIPLLASDAPGFGWLSPVVYRMPLLGTLLKYTRWSLFTKLAAMMLEQRMPLPEAFRLIAGGLTDPYLSRACRKTAFDVENGCRLSDAVQHHRWFPPSLLPFITWGETATALPEAFSSAHELYEGRARGQTTSFMAIVVPITFLTIIVFSGLAILSIFMPLVSLITSLTGGSHRGAVEKVSNFPIEPLVGMLAVLGVGIVILLVKTVVFWAQWPEKKHPLHFFMNVVGWAIVFLTTTALLFFYVNLLLGLFWLFTVPCIVIFVLFQNWRMKQQGLLWMLALASEKLIPLIPAIRAYAAESGGSYSDLVEEFSMLLANGIPLPDAMHMVSGLVPADRYPLICAAYESGALAKGLRDAAESRNLQQTLWGSLSAKMLYIVGMIFFGTSILTFVMIKIVPAFEKIFKDFGTKMPSETLTLVDVSRWIVWYWYLIFPIPFILLVSLFFYSLLKFLGVSVFDLPGMGRFMRRKHAAEIMENLSLAVENHRAIDAALQTLIRCYPNAAVRLKLNRTLADVQAGMPWDESLYRRGLIRQSDLAVLQASQRAGNLPWAMREMADTNRRRLAYRLNVVVQTIFPPVVLGFGAMVLFIVVALFKPLITLIAQLS